MEVFLDSLRKEEQVTLNLRRLYEQFGYKKYRMGKFEEYALYIENKNFLQSEAIITFNDLEGKLLALKPDVTLSIVKHTNATRKSAEKVYYTENIYRLSKRNHEYKEISQMGLEFIGDLDPYAMIEVIGLALSSLNTISPQFLLDISHMGFVTGLFDSLEAEYHVQEQLLSCIRSKNLHELRSIAAQAGISDFYRDKLEKITLLYGDFEQTLDAAQEIVLNDQMQNAVSELRALFEALKNTEFADNIRLDFSIINDVNYYNGIIFRGYVENVPRAVLAGGRYDNLMKRFNKDVGAIGFALYLDELGRTYKNTLQYDVDALILYDEGADYAALFAAVSKLTQDGMRVRAEKEIPADLRAKQTLRFANGTFEEVQNNA